MAVLLAFALLQCNITPKNDMQAVHKKLIGQWESEDAFFDMGLTITDSSMIFSDKPMAINKYNLISPDSLTVFFASGDTITLTVEFSDNYDTLTIERSRSQMKLVRVR